MRGKRGGGIVSTIVSTYRMVFPLIGDGMNSPLYSGRACSPVGTEGKSGSGVGVARMGGKTCATRPRQDGSGFGKLRKRGEGGVLDRRYVLDLMHGCNWL